MENDKSLIELQTNLLVSLKRRLREIRGTEPKSLKEYYRDYEMVFKNFKPSIISYGELLKRIFKNKVILIGDFHTLDQAQKVALELFETNILENKKFAIGLESVYSAHQRDVDSYLKGKLTENELLKKIHYYSEWGFPWCNYAPIFRYAKSRNIPIITLNRIGSLQIRDKFIAGKIERFIEKNPQYNYIIALIGDLHLAPNHLPQKIIEKCGLSPSIVYQNSESIYMKKIKEGKLPNGSFRLKENLFLINRVPPWVKIQSWITFLEHSETILAGTSSKSKSTELEAEEPDPWEWMYSYVKLLKNFFSLRFRPDDTFTLYTIRDLAFLKDTYFSCHDGADYKKIIQHGQSLFIPRKEIIYLPMLDVNHAVQEATHYLMGYPLNLNPNQTGLFMRIHYFSSGYIGSKIVNPSRKTLSIEEMEKFLKGFSKIRDDKDRAYLEEKKCVYENTLKFYSWLKKPEPLPIIESKELYEKDTSHNFSISQLIGRIAGEYIFNKFQVGYIKREELRSYIFERVNPFYLCNMSEIGK